MTNQKFLVGFLLVIIVYFAVVTGPIGYSRFRTPIIPYIMILSAYGMVETWKWFRRKK